MPLTNRYIGTIQGGMITIGNSLSVYQNSTYPPSTDPFNTGAFISTDTANQVAGFPVGTTTDGSRASSSAILNIPSGSTVVFAQLIWLRCSPVNSGSSITFTTPLRTLTIAPTISDDSLSGISYFFRAADVTTIINDDGSGTYTLGNVPVSTAPNGTNIVPANWTLIVVYKNTSKPYQYININTGIFIVGTTTPLNFTFNQFSTPTSGPLKGYFIVAATNGGLTQAVQIRVGNTSADTQIGNTSSPWNGLAPYSRANNMLPGNVLVADPNSANFGLLDTTGTFGTRNLNPYASTIAAFDRIDYDLLGIDISSLLTHSQTQFRTNASTNASSAFLSESVQIQLNSANLGGNLIKTVDKAIANIGDQLTYTMAFTNTGVISAINVNYMDTTPNGTVFLSNSLMIDGVPGKSTNISPGAYVNFGTVYPNETHTVSFKVVITTIPSSLQITNVGSLKYAFSLGVGLTTMVDTVNTNIVTTTINYISNPIINSLGFSYTYTENPSVPNGKIDYLDSSFSLFEINTATLASNKIVNKNFADVNSILAYTIPIVNFGNVAATNVIFQDTIAASTTLIPGSLTINGVVTGGDINPPGINIGTIASGQVFTVAYKINVNTIPSVNPILNSATLKWTYTIDPSIPNGGALSGNTKVVSTQISTVFLNSSKIAPSYGTVGSVLTYTIPIINSGNVSANNVVFKDTIPNGTSFITNSLTQNGITLSGINPNLGFTVGTIAANSITTIVFSVLVTTIPSANPIQNAANITYKYTIDPSIPNEISSSINTNIAYTQISKVFLNANKIVDKNFAAINDILTYTIPLINTGNVSANNVVFKDTIPIGTSFVSDSLTVNGITLNGITPNLGFTVGTVAVGITTISFKLNVDTIPSLNPISNSANIIYTYTVNPSIPNSLSDVANTNIVTTQISTPILNSNIYVDKAFATIRDVLTYTIPIINTGNTIANNVIFKNTIPNGTVFLPDSLILNGVVQTYTTPNTGFVIGSIPIGVTTISFKVTVVELPTINPILNSSNLTYNFTINPSIPNERSGSLNSNLVSTKVNTPVIISTKTADKIYSSLNDVITYTLVFKNIGNTNINNFIVSDTVPNGTTFVTNSIVLNSVTIGGTPSSINVGTIAVNGSSTISFKVKVN